MLPSAKVQRATHRPTAMLATTAEHIAAAELQPPATAGPPDAHHGGAASSSSVTELVASSKGTWRGVGEPPVRGV